MKIAKVEDLHADGGWRVLSFLKVTTDDGLVGWSEFAETRATPGLTMVIRRLAESVIGSDPRDVSQLGATLFAMTRGVAGGMVAQAIAAIENACLDIKAKSLGVPVHDLFGGALRKRLPLYWSHCGTTRVRHAELLGPRVPALRTLDDVAKLGKEVAARGFGCLKTNVLLFDHNNPRNYRPGFGSGHGHPALNVDPRMIGAIHDLLFSFRHGAGPNMGLMLDLNFNFRPEGFGQIARAMEDLKLVWLEMDLHEPRALAAIRHSTTTPIASLETIYGRRALRPYLDAQAVEVAIIDVQWNGMMEAMRMASLIDSHEINVAAHNYHGQLSTLMGAHFCAAVPNFRIMEICVDDVPWIDELFSHKPVIELGVYVMPERPGWGVDVIEEAVRAHPPKAEAAPWMLA